MRSDNSLALPDRGSAPRSTVLCVLFASLAALLVYVRCLIYFNPPPIIFDAAYLSSVLALAIILVQFVPMKHHAVLLLVLVWILVMRMLIPFRLPEGIISNYPDMIYELQIVRSIATTGTITLNSPTIYGEGYVFTPMLETFIAMSSAVLGTPLDGTLKYAGPFFGVLTIAFLYGFFRSFLQSKESVVSAFLGGSCFWFIGFDAHTLHQSLALTFFSLALYTLTKTDSSWRALTILSIFGIVATHQFTAIIASAFFVIAALAILILSRSRLIRPGTVERGVMNALPLMIILTFTQLTFVASFFFAHTLTLSVNVLRTLLSGNTTTFQSLVLPTTPVGYRVIGDVGVITFAATFCIGFLRVLRKRGILEYKRLVPYATGGALLLLFDVLAFWKLTADTDLFYRGFIYVYFFGAPMALFAIFEVSSKSKGSFRKCIAVALICVIVFAGAYANYPRYFHDNSAHWDIEDVRFPLFQWKSAGEFTEKYVPQGVTMWGVRLASDYVGGYGDRNILLIGYSLNGTLSQWISTQVSPGDIIVLRASLPTVPERYPVNQSELNQVIAAHNIVYSSGEVWMIQES